MRNTFTKRIAVAAVIASLFPYAWAETFAIRNAKIHVVSGPAIERGTVVIQDGKIQAVGERVRIPSGAKRIDGRGLEVYPGMFNADTSLGLTEIGQVPVTNDNIEMGDYTPQLMAWSAIHIESEHIPVARVEGITHAVTRPGGGTIAGQGAVVHLDGWNQEEMEIDRSGAMYFSLPSLLSARAARFGGGGRFGRSYKDAKKRFDERVKSLRELFARVRHYDQTRSQGRPVDRQLEALVPVAKGEMLAVFSANSHVDIKEAVNFAQSENLNFAILGASDAWMAADFLAENNVRVILGPRQSLPSRNDDPIYIIYETPRILQEKNVPFAIATGGAANARNLPFEVGNSVAHGLSYEAALRSITLTPAEIFGVADQIGSIETGKLANLVVTDGDIFEYQTKIKHVFIRGNEISLDSKHTELYKKYSAPRTATNPRTP